MDLHLALTNDGHRTHLTSDAVTALCGVSVTDLPEQAGAFCDGCVTAEYALLAQPDSPLSR